MKIDLDFLLDVPSIAANFISKNKETILSTVALSAFVILGGYLLSKIKPTTIPPAIPFPDPKIMQLPKPWDQNLKYCTIPNKSYATAPHIFEVPKKTAPEAVQKNPVPAFLPVEPPRIIVDQKGMLNQTDPCFYGAGFNDWSVPRLD